MRLNISYKRTKFRKKYCDNCKNLLLYIKNVIKDPDYIFEDRKNIDTILMVKNIKHVQKGYRLVVKLNTNIKLKEKSNTIISFWKINKKKLGQFIRNEKMIFEKLDKNE